MMKRIVYALAVAACVSCTPKLGRSSIDRVIGAMTLEEKCHLVIGTYMDESEDGGAVIGSTMNLVPGAAGTTYPIERLGIPALVLADGPAGLRINPHREGDDKVYYCTYFPIGTLLSSSWNTELVEQVGRTIGNEALEYGVDVLLAPALNIHRNPLCGRNFEYYSEDPLLSGKTAAAYVRGIQSNGVGTSIKHFAANNQETNRCKMDSRVSPRALREIYLKGFEIAVKEASPWTLMSSYNYLNGVYTSENPQLLTDVLRNDWGFEGMVMTDWFGGVDIVAQMNAGNDMIQPGTAKQYETLLSAVRNGELDEAVLDRNVARVLEMIEKSPKFRKYDFSNNPDLEAHKAVVRQSSNEGMVLLKNDASALPWTGNIRKVALFGCTSYDFIAGGSGSGQVNGASVVSLLDGLMNSGYEIDHNLKEIYSRHIEHEKLRNALDPNAKYTQVLAAPKPEEILFSSSDMKAYASSMDVALVTIGRISGEFYDRTSSDFNLKKNEIRLIRQVCEAFHKEEKKVVVVLNVGGPVETASWKDIPDAILCAWQAGQEGGNTVTDILSGKVSPSGKLPMTFPISLEDVPSTSNFPVDMVADIEVEDNAGRNGNVRNLDYTNYEEDIYVGYRYYDSFGKAVSYPFGYGLSYTTFDFSWAEIEEISDNVFEISVEVRNTGSVPGKEVVQVYATAPDALVANKPEKELKAFAKTSLLSPGEKERVKLTVRAEDLASYDQDNSCWRVTEGEYVFSIGASLADSRIRLKTDIDAMTIGTSNSLGLNNAENQDFVTLKRTTF